jgi:iron-sulfur cluster assembly accessory protein
VFAVIRHVVISVTDTVIRQIQAVLAETPERQGRGLRISVEKGGCAGMQYEMEFDLPKEDDFRYARDGVEVIIDPQSAPYLDGVSLDYVDGLTGAGFRIENPNAVRNCGCGTSFEVTRDT